MMKPLVLAQEDTPVVKSTKELCQTILDQPAYQVMRKSIQEFLSNPLMRGHYQRLCDKQEMLHEKHEQGLAITDEEIADFEKDESAFLASPVAQEFIEAQRAMHKIEETVSAYVRKTFELGRMPTDADFESGSCGPSCGCHG